MSPGGDWQKSGVRGPGGDATGQEQEKEQEMVRETGGDQEEGSRGQGAERGIQTEESTTIVKKGARKVRTRDPLKRGSFLRMRGWKSININQITESLGYGPNCVLIV